MDAEVSPAMIARQSRVDPDLVPQFATGPSDAVQCLLDCRSYTAKVRAAILRDPRVLASLQGTVMGFFSEEDKWREWVEMLNMAPVYFWSSSTATLVRQASETFPLLEEEAADAAAAIATFKQTGAYPPPPSYLPRHPAAFCVFEQPTLAMQIDGFVKPISGLIWRMAYHAPTAEVWICVRAFTWSGSMVVPIWWSDGGSVGREDAEVDGTFRAERLAFIKWICTASLFLDQQITVSHQERPNRSVRRRCERENIPEPICHVVMLRKELHDDSVASTPGTSEVDWSHRWIVRGHWRRQYYPSRGGHTPLWIHEHVKGPDDKPFLPPKPTVFTVTR